VAWHAEVVERLADVPAGEWDALDGSGNPFITHAFLEALESHGCVGGDSGWAPRHLLLRDDAGRLAGAVPRYEKAHSWGEFVFDWNWAQSYARAGLPYYPKQLAAVPFTPVTGPRLLVRAGPDAAGLRGTLAQWLVESAGRDGVSGTHVNFTTEEDQAALEDAGFLGRHDCRFLWRNHGYRDFEDFLEGLRSDKRKKLRRERRRVAEAGIEVDTLPGEQIGEALWQTIFGFTERTFLRHGNAHYLTSGFLAEVARRLPGAVVVVLARQAGIPLAASIFVQGGGTLYGRYWGAAPSTASRTDSNPSTREPRASTSSRAGSRRRSPPRRTGSRTGLSARRWHATSSASARPWPSTSRPPPRTCRSSGTPRRDPVAAAR
jgi:predicted N-acyltransferase